MYNICKIALGFAVSSLILNATIPVSAATVKFDLSFFDNNEVQVGDGQFTYDDETTVRLV